MSEKVKVSKEVAKEVKYAKEEFRYELSALKYLFMEAEIDNDDDVLVAIKAYLNGYEVIQTADEIINEAYHFKYGNAWGSGYQEGVQYGIKKALDTVGIQIKGVNA